MVSKQEKLVDAILRAAPGSRVLSVTSNMAAPDPTSLLTTSVLLAVLLPRPPWAGIEVTQTTCGLCAGGEATRQAPAEYMTFGDMRADPDWGRVVEETLQHKRLPARDVKTAEREFDKEGIRGTPVTAYLQLDMCATSLDPNVLNTDTPRPHPSACLELNLHISSGFFLPVLSNCLHRPSFPAIFTALIPVAE